MSTSRGGRKGIWAGYYLAISPNGNSMLGAGVWQPGKDELATMRHNILQKPSTLRDAISRPEFVELFGQPKPHPKGTRQNVFGHDDALKVAPKLEGVDKTHKDIDLLKLRSVAVIKRCVQVRLVPAFTDLPVASRTTKCYNRTSRIQSNLYWTSWLPSCTCTLADSVA